jgi:hypothetical protein
MGAGERKGAIRDVHTLFFICLRLVLLLLFLLIIHFFLVLRVPANEYKF